MERYLLKSPPPHRAAPALAAPHAAPSRLGPARQGRRRATPAPCASVPARVGRAGECALRASESTSME